MLRRAPFMTDNQRNARVMWKQNNTHEFSKASLSEEDHQFIRREALTADRSGVSQKIRLEQSEKWEHRAEDNSAKKVKAQERKADSKRKLAGVRILEGATLKELMRLRVSALDEQIDKLRENGDRKVRAKSTISKKEAKAEEILKALARYRSRKAVDLSASDSIESCNDAECWRTKGMRSRPEE